MNRRVITKEMNDGIKEMEIILRRKSVFLEKARLNIMEWALVNSAGVAGCHYIPHVDKSIDVYVFYKREGELKKHIETGIVEKTKQEFMRILEEIGYITEFNDVVRFEFDSDENVKKNYQGNYFLRLR